MSQLVKNSKNSQLGVIKVISSIYFLIGAGFIVGILLESEIQGVRLGWVDAWFAIPLMVIAIGTIRRTKWGRWLMYFVSVISLAGVPIGTLLGWFMIWNLTKYRREFDRWC